MPVDVLDHHNGIVDHEAHGNRKRHQREIVEAEIEKIHRSAGAKQRERDGNAGDERGPEIAQEQQDDEDDKGNRERQRELDVAHRGTDRRGTVEYGLDLHARRYSGRELRQLRLDLIDRVDHVGARLLEHGQNDPGLIVLVRRHGAIDCVRDGLTDVPHTDRRSVAIGQNDVVELLGIGDLVVRGDREAELVRVDGAFCGIGGGRYQSAADLFQGDAARSELCRIDLDSDRRLPVAEYGDLCDPGHLGDLLRQEKIAVIVHLGQRHRIGMRRQQENGGIRRIDLLVVRRRGHGLRQGLAGDRDCRLHVLGRRIDVAVELELNDDRRRAERAQRGELRDPGDLCELPLERSGDRRCHGFGARPLKARGDLDGGEVHLGQRRDRQERIGGEPHECERRHDKGGGNRPADEWFGKVHEAPPDAATGGGAMVTGAPRLSLYCPPVTTRSPSCSPDDTTARSFVVGPSSMGRGSAVLVPEITHANRPCGPRWTAAGGTTTALL